MSRKIKIPVQGTDVFDMRRTRGYISIRNKKMRFYHKFKSVEEYNQWIDTGFITFLWNDTVDTLFETL